MWTQADEDAWNLWNRARTSGVCYKELTRTITVLSKKTVVLLEVNLNPDERKINNLSKERNESILLGLLNRLIT